MIPEGFPKISGRTPTGFLKFQKYFKDIDVNITVAFLEESCSKIIPEGEPLQRGRKVSQARDKSYKMFGRFIQKV